jgi:hypothetical protein
MVSGRSQVFSALVHGLLGEGLSVRFRASGRSMLPALRDGECLIVARARAADVDVGDVVLCDTPRGPVAHRVASIHRADGEARFTLRGDASLECDDPVAAPQVRGRIVSVERDGRRVSMAIRGGWLGRRVFTAALRGRLGLAMAARAWLAPSPLPLAAPAPAGAAPAR